MQRAHLNPANWLYAPEAASDELDLVCSATLAELTAKGFTLPKGSINTTNLKNALWEIIGDANEGAIMETLNPQTVRQQLPGRVE